MLSDETPKGSKKKDRLVRLVERSRKSDGSVLTYDYGTLNTKQLDEVKRARIEELVSAGKKVQKNLNKLDKNVDDLMELRKKLKKELEQINTQLKNYEQL